MIIMRIVRTNWGWITASPGRETRVHPPPRRLVRSVFTRRNRNVPPTGACAIPSERCERSRRVCRSCGNFRRYLSLPTAQLEVRIDVLIPIPGHVMVRRVDMHPG
jgi:hypothetical protein